MYENFWGFYKDTQGPLNGGGDILLGSRLLDEKALTGDLTKLAEAIEIASGGPRGGGTNISLGVYLVGPGGNSSRKVVPRGGDSPATTTWKTALVHAGMFLVAFFGLACAYLACSFWRVVPT